VTKVRGKKKGEGSIREKDLPYWENKNIHERGNSPTGMKTIFKKKARIL